MKNKKTKTMIACLALVCLLYTSVVQLHILELKLLRKIQWVLQIWKLHYWKKGSQKPVSYTHLIERDRRAYHTGMIQSRKEGVEEGKIIGKKEGMLEAKRDYILILFRKEFPYELSLIHILYCFRRCCASEYSFSNSKIIPWWSNWSIC